MTAMQHTPSLRRLAFAAVAVALTLSACGSDSPDASDTSDSTSSSAASTSSEPSTSAPDTTAPDTTDVPTTPAPTQAPTTTGAPAPTGPTVTSLGTSKKNPTCAEVTAAGYQWKVSWKAVNVASVTLSIDGLGAYETGLPAQGSYNIPASCGDTQEVYITPVAGNGSTGTPKKIVITIGA